ncbi:DUF2059 domain-containing protein [Glacieibacterium frigidum]|nr:DUF2059 domain-containing protein [Glacieibacterium frigidum]
MVIAALLLAAPAVAQAAPDVATMAAAKALFEQLGGPAQIRQNAERNLAELRTGASLERSLSRQRGFTMARAQRPQDYDAAFARIGKLQADAAEPIIREGVPAVINAAILAYATHYSAAELRGLAEFYRSPLGQAFQRSQGKVTRDAATALNERIIVKVTAALKLLEPQMTAELKRLQPGKAK